MNERTPVCHAENSATERVVIVCQLEEMAGVVEHLGQMPIRLALDTLDLVIEDCEEILTNLEALRKWANQATEGVNIPF